MTAPIEFSPEYVAEHSPREAQLFTNFLKCGEPWRSLYKNNPWLTPPDLTKPLPWGEAYYWDTTVARKHPFWKTVALPQPSKDIRVLRHDLKEWGYCLIEEAMSERQRQAFLERVTQQAAGERKAGLSYPTPTGQYVNTLINKGKLFSQCIEQDPAAVQAGPVIEQLMNETLGPGWICHSFLANGADPGGYPQGLHIDQGPLAPWMTQEAPALVNTMYIPQDVNEENGGTLMIPGSHKIMIEAGSGGEIGEVPPAINLEAKGGTIMVFDGRVLHGTGVNKTNQQRYVATMSNVKSWMRTQENWVISVAPDVLAEASDKLKHRLGLQALTYGATIEGFGLGGTGRIGEARGAITQFREAYDSGTYERVRTLSDSSTSEDLNKPYTVRGAMQTLKKQQD
ncbi:MAG: phytanoyl-CoA dioxygenase family protein [Pseudomonadota bacterium]